MLRCQTCRQLADHRVVLCTLGTRHPDKRLEVDHQDLEDVCRRPRPSPESPIAILAHNGDAIGHDRLPGRKATTGPRGLNARVKSKYTFAGTAPL
jgi:hypothetical protein